MTWWERPLYALDLETNSADPFTAEIVSWALVKLAPTGHVLEHVGGISQVTEWNPSAEAVHGIPHEASELGTPAIETHNELDNHLAYVSLQRAPLVVFNARYDLTILSRHGCLEGMARHVAVLDPLVMDKHAHKYRKGKRRLVDMAGHYGVPLTGAHDAMADAVAAGRLAYALADKHPVLRVHASDLHAHQIEWAAEQAKGLQAHFRKTNPAARVEGAWPVIPHEARQIVGTP